MKDIKIVNIALSPTVGVTTPAREMSKMDHWFNKIPVSSRISRKRTY